MLKQLTYPKLDFISVTPTRLIRRKCLMEHVTENFFPCFVSKMVHVIYVMAFKYYKELGFSMFSDEQLLRSDFDNVLRNAVESYYKLTVDRNGITVRTGLVSSGIQPSTYVKDVAPLVTGYHNETKPLERLAKLLVNLGRLLCVNDDPIKRPEILDIVKTSSDTILELVNIIPKKSFFEFFKITTVKADWLNIMSQTSQPETFQSMWMHLVDKVLEVELNKIYNYNLADLCKNAFRSIRLGLNVSRGAGRIIVKEIPADTEIGKVTSMLLTVVPVIFRNVYNVVKAVADCSDSMVTTFADSLSLVYTEKLKPTNYPELESLMDEFLEVPLQRLQEVTPGKLGEADKSAFNLMVKSYLCENLWEKAIDTAAKHRLELESLPADMRLRFHDHLITALIKMGGRLTVDHLPLNAATDEIAEYLWQIVYYTDIMHKLTTLICNLSYWKGGEEPPSSSAVVDRSIMLQADFMIHYVRLFEEIVPDYFLPSLAFNAMQWLRDKKVLSDIADNIFNITTYKQHIVGRPVFGEQIHPDLANLKIRYICRQYATSTHAVHGSSLRFAKTRCITLNNDNVSRIREFFISLYSEGLDDVINNIYFRASEVLASLKDKSYEEILAQFNSLYPGLPYEEAAIEHFKRKLGDTSDELVELIYLDALTSTPSKGFERFQDILTEHYVINSACTKTLTQNMSEVTKCFDNYGRIPKILITFTPAPNIKHEALPNVMGEPSLYFTAVRPRLAKQLLSTKKYVEVTSAQLLNLLAVPADKINAIPLPNIKFIDFDYNPKEVSLAIEDNYHALDIPILSLDITETSEFKSGGIIFDRIFSYNDDKLRVILHVLAAWLDKPPFYQDQSKTDFIRTQLLKLLKFSADNPVIPEFAFTRLLFAESNYVLYEGELFDVMVHFLLFNLSLLCDGELRSILVFKDKYAKYVSTLKLEKKYDLAKTFSQWTDFTHNAQLLLGLQSKVKKEWFLKTTYIESTDLFER